MRLSNVILVLSLGGVGAAGALVGCGSDPVTGGTSTTGSGGSTSATTGSNTTSGGTDPCSPSAACPQVAASKCIGLADNSAAKAFTLRMANLTLTAPPALTKGLVKGVVQNGVTMNLASCNLNGGGTFSWLLQFDTATGMLKTGGGTPAEDPTKGYSFVDKTITQGGKDFKIAPFTASAPIGSDGAFAITMGANVTVPVYLDLKASAVVLLPLHDAKLTGVVSSDKNCIGQYNSKNLDPAGGCLADDKTPSFIGGDGKADSDGKLEGYITLEEADTVIVDAIGSSLCVILSGDPATFGDGKTPALCKRTAAVIDFKGDWCDATNDATCKDSIRLAAGFSASSVKSPSTP